MFYFPHAYGICKCNEKLCGKAIHWVRKCCIIIQTVLNAKYMYDYAIFCAGTFWHLKKWNKKNYIKV